MRTKSSDNFKTGQAGRTTMSDYCRKGLAAVGQTDNPSLIRLDGGCCPPPLRPTDLCIMHTHGNKEFIGSD